MNDLGESRRPRLGARRRPTKGTALSATPVSPGDFDALADFERAAAHSQRLAGVTMLLPDDLVFERSG